MIRLSGGASSGLYRGPSPFGSRMGTCSEGSRKKVKLQVCKGVSEQFRSAALHSAFGGWGNCYETLDSPGEKRKCQTKSGLKHLKTAEE